MISFSNRGDDEKRAEISPNEKRRLSQVYHPSWSSADDYYLLQASKQGKNFFYIADELGRTRIAIEQRYHRLRSVKNIEELLEKYGISDDYYAPE